MSLSTTRRSRRMPHWAAYGITASESRTDKDVEEVNESEDKQGENRDEKVTMFLPFSHSWRPNSR